MAVTAYLLDASGFRAADLAGCAGAIGRDGAVVWIDVHGSEPEVVPFLRDRLKLHPLAIEDIFSERVTPKIEDFKDHLYMVMHAVRKDGDRPEDLRTLELDVIVGSNWVVTHHADEVPAIEAVLEELRRNPLEMERGPAFLAHGIIDRLTDLYLPVVDKFEEELDGIENAVVERPRREHLRRLFQLKRSLQRLRRLSAYQRDMLLRLSHGEFSQIPEKALVFYRDVYDHFVRIADLADGYREIITSALEIYTSTVANRTNDVMKALTVVSSVLLPLNLIAGLWGMNFDRLPGRHFPWGFEVTVVVMLVLAGALFWWFRRRRWI